MMIKYRAFYDVKIKPPKGVTVAGHNIFGDIEKTAEQFAAEFVNVNHIKGSQFTARGDSVVVWWEEEGE
jgi:hypothetical protein